jgi:tRNA 5-methylaminomethyl-2-thiouridine biosynthesis bifunctional protein
MNSVPIVPAELAFDENGIPRSALYDDIYHPKVGALPQARHVFLQGNELPERWRGLERFTVLETGFGLGNNFLATWRAWRDDPNRCERLYFVSIEQNPLSRADLELAHANHCDPSLRELAGELHQSWPPLTHNLHQLDFDAHKVRLLLAFGDVQAWLTQLIVSVDAFYLDGFAPASNPRMWDERVCKALGRLAAPHATLATWSAARSVRNHLVTAGFEVRLAQGTGGKRDITMARFAPPFTPRRALTRTASSAPTKSHALIIGAGLAGCAAAWALAEQGWSTTVLERRERIALETSGNPAGLFHGIVNAHDGIHARFNRAAAFSINQAVNTALDRHHVLGNARGLLRLEKSVDLPSMQSTLERLRLPCDYVQAIGAGQASILAGIELSSPAWFYPGGGWVQPGGLARSFLERAADLAQLRTGVDAATLSRIPSGWRLLNAQGHWIAEAATVVLANAGDAVRLLDNPDWPIDAVRGQLSMMDLSGAQGQSMISLPRLPIAGSGYLLPAINGSAIFGATTQRADHDPSVRQADHLVNIAQLEQLLGHPLLPGAHSMQGRTAWRFSARDRLPVIGAIPDVAASVGGRLDQPRFVPRLPGLYVFTALGSRGITWSALGAQVLASCVTGAPMPVEADLLDAVDPARFVARKARQANHVASLA